MGLFPAYVNHLVESSRTTLLAVHCAALFCSVHLWIVQPTPQLKDMILPAFVRWAVMDIENSGTRAACGLLCLPLFTECDILTVQQCAPGSVHHYLICQATSHYINRQCSPVKLLWDSPSGGFHPVKLKLGVGCSVHIDWCQVTSRWLVHLYEQVWRRRVFSLFSVCLRNKTGRS